MELETLRVKLKYKKKNKSNFFDKEINELEIQIASMSDREREAQMLLSKEVFSDASLKRIRHYCNIEKNRLESSLDEIKAVLKQHEIKNMDLEEKSETISSKIKTKSIIVSFSNIIKPGSDNKSVACVGCQWNFAEKKKEHLLSEITSWSSKMKQKEKKEEEIEKEIENLDEDYQKELKNVLTFRFILSKLNASMFNDDKTGSCPHNCKKEEPRDHSTIHINESERVKDREKQKEKKEEEIENLDEDYQKELKNVLTSSSILSKLNASMFNDDKTESCPHNYKKEEPRDHSTIHINESERVKDTEKYDGKKKLKVVKLKEENQIEVDRSLEDVPKKYDNVKTAQLSLTNSETVNESNEDPDLEDTISQAYNDNDPEVQLPQLLPDNEIITTKTNDNDTEHEFDKKEKFDNDYQIIIESMSQTDLSYDVEVWDSDERLKVVESKVFPDGFKLDTDIFYIKESTAGNFHGNEKKVVNDVLLKVLHPMENNSYYEYKGAVKFGNAWRLIDCICQDSCMVFEIKEVESFCVLSFVRQEKSTVLPTGSQFISEIDNRIQVTFPPYAVSKEEQLSFKIHPVNFKCILERTTEPTNDQVYAITPGISTRHIKFKEMFKVQLPLLFIPELCDTIKDYIYYIFKWNDDGSFELTDIQPVVNNGLVFFETNSFSGYSCVGTTTQQDSSSLESTVQEIYELKKWCQILFFVGKTSNNNVPIMLECVEKHRVAEVCEKRIKIGYHFVSDWISKDLHFTPYSTIISVEVKGRFKIPKESSIRLPRLSFIPVARDNFFHFLVEWRGSGVPYGILSFRVGRNVLYDIYHDPDRYKQAVNPMKKGRTPIVKETVVKGSSTKKKGEEENKGMQVNITPNFFTEKGLLALTKLISPETMLDVCINMDMLTATYDTIQQKYGVGTRGNIALLKTALDQQPHNKKVENFIAALIAAGQKSMAEKMKHLHTTGQDLHEISTCESVMKK
ncbi:uncharacterized protein PF3D7_1120000-like isoform X2 [Mytilus edulis]